MSLLCPFLQVYMASVPFVHHKGYGVFVDDLMDLWDFIRELGALGKYYWKGYICVHEP